MVSRFKGALRFRDEETARAWFEAARWSGKPVCPHCQSDQPYATKKAGRYRCANRHCRKDFTVMTGTVMERSHAPLTHWAVAFHLAASYATGFGATGFGATELQRALGCAYNTAWFLHRRVVEAMRRGGLDVAISEPDAARDEDGYYGEVEHIIRRTSKTRQRYAMR